MPATDLPLLIDAALAAGEIALGHFRADPETWEKSDGSPVSAADIEVDGALNAALTAARPAYAWLSEEAPDDLARLTAQHCFVVDPIDGTRAFLAGQSAWSISLAVVEGGQVTAGVVYLPVKRRLYAAALGQGATCDGAAITASPRTDLDGATLIGAKAALDPKHWRDLPRLTRQFRPSLAYRLALVAEGRYDAMFTPRPAWEWDIAAGSLLVTEAGGAVTDRHGAALRFNTEGRRLDGVLAAGAVHGGLLARLV